MPASAKAIGPDYTVPFHRFFKFYLVFRFAVPMLSQWIHSSSSSKNGKKTKRKSEKHCRVVRRIVGSSGATWSDAEAERLSQTTASTAMVFVYTADAQQYRACMYIVHCTCETDTYRGNSPSDSGDRRALRNTHLWPTKTDYVLMRTVQRRISYKLQFIKQI